MSNIKEVLSKLVVSTQDLDFRKAHPNTQQHHKNVEQALAEIKRIIEESQPEKVSTIDLSSDISYNMALDKYHNNLLKALGE